MIDFHTHILPDIDDGSASTEESVEMLKMLEQQGVSKVVLTPHFYAHKTGVAEFSEKRRKSLNKLLDAMKNEQIKIELYLGSEVLYFDELWRIDELKDLCIQGTKYILVEMPFSTWQDTTVKCIENLISKGYTPIIAHFERYIEYKGNTDKIREIVGAGALLQMNCSALESFFKRRAMGRYIKNGMVFAIGTDAHNLISRAPNISKATVRIRKILSERQYMKFFSRQDAILRDATRIG